MEKALLIESDSPEGSEKVAQAFAHILHGGETVLLEGELGAGKTFFVRALARELGVHQHVTSPTFVLQKSYSVPSEQVHSIVHYDVYRMGSYDELADIGFEELAEDAVALVEWGDRFWGAYPGRPWRLRFEYAQSDEGRLLHALAPDAGAKAEFEQALKALGISFKEGDFPAGEAPAAE